MVVIISPVSSQDIDMDAVRAEDEFQWGVRSFHNGFFNKAIFSFEKSLSYKPDDPQTKLWLGRAYYRSGFELAALRLWESMLETGYSNAILQNLVDALRFRRGFGRELAQRERYVIETEIAPGDDEYKLYSRPTTVTPRKDGSFYVTAFASNEIVLINANGALIRRLQGGIEGLDHPFDMVETDQGDIYVTEFRGNRIAQCDRDGYVIRRFGSSGRDGGNLIGPQYIDLDDKGYLYVTEIGNRRVSKFDKEGNFILSFGEKNQFFEGFLSPSGILVHQERLFVADNIKRCLFVFDVNGNYITTLGKGMFHAPEHISLLHEQRLLIADTDRIVSFDIDKEVVTEISDVEGKAEKILSAAVDANDNLITVDFNNENIYFLSELSTLYGGLIVLVDKVYSDNFPNVQISVDVQTREGSPVIGLNRSNFIITENHRPVSGLSFEFASHQAETADIAILVEKSETIRSKTQDIRHAVQTLTEAISSRGSVRVVTAGAQPVVVSGAAGEDQSGFRNLFSTGFTAGWRFDQGLRMAVSELIPSRNKRAVVCISSGSLGEKAFEQYNLIELKQYLVNNSIAFYCVYVEQNTESEDLEYLCNETGGNSYFLYRAEGISGLVESIVDQRNGLYVLSYTSGSQTDFGEAFIPVEVETFYFKKSGRDESGYFAPLEF